jgi:AcrR family transcriptional regulator
VAETTEQNPSYQRILDAGQALFLEKGFPATSMEAIAKRAKVVRSTVYNNFQDKEAIVAELMRTYVEGYVEIPRRLREQARPGQTSFELIEAMITEAILWRIENAELRPLIDLSKHLPNSPWGGLNDAADAAMLGWIMEIHRHDAGLGLIREGLDLDFATTAAYSMIESVIASFDVGASRARVAGAVRQLTLMHWHALYNIEPSEAPAWSPPRVSAKAPRRRRRPARA